MFTIKVFRQTCPQMMLAALLSFTCQRPAFGGAPKARFGSEEVISGLLDTYRKVARLPGLEVHYKATAEDLAPRSQTMNLYVWPWVEITVKMRPREFGKMYVRVRHPTFGRPGNPPDWQKEGPTFKFTPGVVFDDVATSDGDL